MPQKKKCNCPCHTLGPGEEMKVCESNCRRCDTKKIEQKSIPSGTYNNRMMTASKKRV